MKYIIAAIATILLLNGPAARAQNPGSGLCSYPKVTTPLSGTECWPLNQNGVTKTVTAAGFFKNAVQGPNSSVVGDAAVWNGTTGIQLADAGAPPLFKIATNYAMQNFLFVTSAAGFTVMRTGYYAAGDSPATVYVLSTSPCSLNAGAGDGGSQVPANSGAWCWLIGNQTIYDVRQWGAVGTTTTTTGTISQGSPSLSVASSSGYSVGQAIDVYGAGSTSTVNAPTSVTMVTEGTTASVTYHAQVVAIDSDHGYGPASGIISGDGSGNATLQVPQAGSDAQDQLISWSAPSGTVPTSYAVYDDAVNTSPGSGALICRGVTVQTFWRDYGQIQNSLTKTNECPSWLPTNPPTSAGKDLFRATIVSPVVGNTLVLSSNAPNACSGCTVEHDDTAPIQNAVNVKTVTLIPCGNFHTTGGITLTGNNKTLRGNNKGCSLIAPSGSFEITTLGGTGTTYFSQEIDNLQITALDMASGDCMFIQNTNRFIVDNIELSNCYNEMQINNVFIAEIHDFFSSTRRRGDYGWWLWANGSGGGTQTANLELRHVNTANAYQGISFHLDGNVASLRARYLGIQSGPFEMVSNNAVAAPQTPIYGQFYDTGFNVCWRLCLNVTDGTLMQFYSPYIQQVNGGGANNHAVVISAVDNTATPATGSVGFQIHGGTVFGGNDVILDNGNGTIIEGANIFGNFDAAIECGPFSNGLLVTGVNTYNAPANIPIAAQDYGMKLDAGCSNATVLGTFVGQKSNVLNNTSPTQEVNVNGQIDPPQTTVLTATPYTLTNATYPWVYQGQAGAANIIEVSGSFSAQNLTTDTATNIIAGLNNPQVGTQIWFIVRNHNHKATSGGADAVLTLVGGAGVTITGTATVPDAAQGQVTSGGVPQSGIYTFRKFVGTITNVGAPAITIHGCSTTAGAAC